ncbi:Protein boule [Lucilia cuprina]|nr:Protein boule [Lucilia cuprina]
MHKMAAPTGAAPPAAIEGALSAPKYGTLIPNRIFVGGISGDTTESDLCRVFSAYGNVKSTKIIVDRAGVSKGYGFVTFETEQEAQRLQTDPLAAAGCATDLPTYMQIYHSINTTVCQWGNDAHHLGPKIIKAECVVLRDRKLNIAPAIKKQSIVAANGAVYYTTTPPAPISNMPIDQFAAAVYPPAAAAAGVPTIYPPSMQYQPFYQYYSVPMNVPTIWPQNYQVESTLLAYGGTNAAQL